MASSHSSHHERCPYLDAPRYLRVLPESAVSEAVHLLDRASPNFPPAAPPLESLLADDPSVKLGTMVGGLLRSSCTATAQTCVAAPRPGCGCAVRDVQLPCACADACGASFRGRSRWCAAEGGFLNPRADRVGLVGDAPQFGVRRRRSVGTSTAPHLHTRPSGSVARCECPHSWIYAHHRLLSAHRTTESTCIASSGPLDIGHRDGGKHRWRFLWYDDHVTRRGPYGARS